MNSSRQRKWIAYQVKDIAFNAKLPPPLGPPALGPLGFTSEEGEIFRGCCDAEENRPSPTPQAHLMVWPPSKDETILSPDLLINQSILVNDNTVITD